MGSLVTPLIIPTIQQNRPPRPLWLMRRWKRAAGPVAGWHVPAAPFTALQLFGEPRLPLRQRRNPATLDRLARDLAERLAATDQAEAVQSGEAAFIFDLPGALSIGLGCHLQAYGMTPVLLFGGLYRLGSIVEGHESLPAIIRYAPQIQPWQTAGGFAFLLERERTGPPDLDDLGLWRSFDNRYHAGEYLFPPLDTLKTGGLTALIDLRAEGDELPSDLDGFYQVAALAGINVYQAFLPADWLLGNEL